MTNNKTAIKMIDFLRAVAATQPTADNRKGSTMKKLLEALKPAYPMVTPTDIMHIRDEATCVKIDDKSKQLVVKEETDYHHTLTPLGKQVLADLETANAAATTAQEPVEA